MSERNDANERSREDEATKSVDESEERAMSVFASERREDVIAIVIAFAFALFALVVHGVGG